MPTPLILQYVIQYVIPYCGRGKKRVVVTQWASARRGGVVYHKLVATFKPSYEGTSSKNISSGLRICYPGLESRVTLHWKAYGRVESSSTALMLYSVCRPSN